MSKILNEGLYLLKTREFFNSKQEIYKIGRSHNLSKRVLNYPNKSIVYLMIECIDSPLHEQNIIKLFTSKYKAEYEYGKEYFSGIMNEMRYDIINYVKQIMNDKHYNMIIDTIILDRKTLIGNKTLYIHQLEFIQCITYNPSDKSKLPYNNQNISLENKDKCELHKCNDCDKDFITKTRLKRHYTNKLKCNKNIEDTKVETNSIDTQKHITKPINLEFLRDQIKDYKLDIKEISLLIAYLDDYKNDMLEQIQIDDISCDNCGQQFTHKKSLYRHARLNRCKAKESSHSVGIT